MVTRSETKIFFSPQNIVRLYQEISKLAAAKNYIIPIDLRLLSTSSIKHSTALVISKSLNKIEYIFMDRLNWKMTSNKNYMSIINTLIRWVSNPEYFKKTIIRAGYFTSVYWVINHRDYYLSSNLFTYLIILKDLSLLNDKFYTEYYKKPLCKLVNDNLRGEDKSELLVSFLCDSL